MCVNGWESEDPFSVNSYESEYPKNDESANIYESGKISSSVNLVSAKNNLFLLKINFHWAKFPICDISTEGTKFFSLMISQSIIMIITSSLYYFAILRGCIDK